MLHSLPSLLPNSSCRRHKHMVLISTPPLKPDHCCCLSLQIVNAQFRLALPDYLHTAFKRKDNFFEIKGEIRVSGVRNRGSENPCHSSRNHVCSSVISSDRLKNKMSVHLFDCLVRAVLVAGQRITPQASSCTSKEL